MARRKEAGHGGGHGWFVTFADLMGLLVSFFVMLVAFSTQDQAKLQVVAGSMSTSFFLSRRALKPATQSGMPRWQDRLFIGLTRLANDATDYFQIPTGRVVEVGTQVTI